MGWRRLVRRCPGRHRLAHFVTVRMTNTAVAVGTIRVGLTEAHGMAKELSQFPTDGVAYSFLRPLTSSGVGMSGCAIKGFVGRYEADDVDLIEAVLGSIRTKSRWLCSLAHIAEACGFDSDAGVPRAV